MNTCSNSNNQKRKLHFDEIESILSFLDAELKYPHQEVTISNHKIKLRNQLKEVLIYPTLIPNLKEQIINRFYKSRLHANEMLGVLAATSLGQPTTQLVLNSFHQSGVLNVASTTGVPRLEEILGLTKNQKSRNMKCILVPEFNNLSIKEKYNLVKPLEQQFFENFIISKSLITNTLKEIYNDWNKYKSKWITRLGVNLRYISKTFIRLYLDRNIIYKYNLDLTTIALKVQSIRKDIIIIPSPIKYSIIDVHYYLDIKSDDDDIPTNLSEIEHFLFFVYNEIKDCHIGGIKGIEQIYVSNKEINTVGSNILGMMMTNMFSNVYSNDIWEVYHSLGIEAAKQCIIQELNNVFAGGATTVDIRHIQLLADGMTRSGIIKPVTRYGIDRKIVGPFAKASFEQATDNFIKAGINGESDDFKGISSEVIVGKLSSIGTGKIHLLHDVLKEISFNSREELIEHNNPSQYLSDFVVEKDDEIEILIE